MSTLVSIRAHFLREISFERTITAMLQSRSYLSFKTLRQCCQKSEGQRAVEVLPGGRRINRPAQVGAECQPTKLTKLNAPEGWYSGDGDAVALVDV